MRRGRACGQVIPEGLIGSRNLPRSKGTGLRRAGRAKARGTDGPPHVSPTGAWRGERKQAANV